MTVPPIIPATGLDSESDSKRNETQAETRARLQAEHIAAERRKLMARAGASPTAMRSTAPASITARGAAALAGEAHPAPVPEAGWQKVGRAIGDAVGRVVEKAKIRGGQVFHPKMLRIDVKDAREKVPPPLNWLRDVVADFERRRVIAVDVSVLYFQSVAAVYETMAGDGRGFVLDSYAAIGRRAKLGRPAGREKESYGRETVRKCREWLEDSGWLGALNTLYRREEDNKQVRDSNVYLLFGPDDAAACQALEPSARAEWRVNLTKARGAALWGMAVNAFGLHVTTRADRRRGHHAPA